MGTVHANEKRVRNREKTHHSGQVDSGRAPSVGAKHAFELFNGAHQKHGADARQCVRACMRGKETDGAHIEIISTMKIDKNVQVYSAAPANRAELAKAV